MGLGHPERVPLHRTGGAARGSGRPYNRTPQEDFMRPYVLGTIVMLTAAAAFAQQRASQTAPAAPKLFASAADVTAMMAKAKSERKPDQVNFIQPIVQL